MRNLLHRPLATGLKGGVGTILLCPACNNEISLTELIERKGYVGCISCTR
ncbi:MAG: hypothetical protein HYS62_00735 [Candidatus Aenigmarchaeota archaeon]|nr:hypothetical protein [Candidatus Aenigmarchaeota archaeon]